MARFLMRGRRLLRIASVAAVASTLAACNAVDRVQQDMTRDWRKFEQNVLNKDEAQKPVTSRAPARAETARKSDVAPPMPPMARPPVLDQPRAVEKSAPENPEIADLRALAESGDPEAQYQLGLRYDTGQAVTRDPEEALRWYRSAGEQGHTLGALNSGLLYDSGEGVPREATAAAAWYRKAAEAGNGRAAYNLGQLYENGEGVPRDSAQAAAWYDKAQRAGIAAAGPKLAALSPRPTAALTRESLAPFAPPSFESGRQTPAKTPESLHLALAKDYAMGQSAPDDGLVADAIRAAAESGDLQAACNLGMRHVNGRGVSRDWAQGERWLRRAADRGYAPAQTNLAMLLANEQNPKADAGEALMWASKAANAGYGPARAQLGMMYATGRGVAADRRMADFWLASAQRDMREPAGSCKLPPTKDSVSAR